MESVIVGSLASAFLGIIHLLNPAPWQTKVPDLLQLVPGTVHGE